MIVAGSEGCDTTEFPQTAGGLVRDLDDSANAGRWDSRGWSLRHAGTE